MKDRRLYDIDIISLSNKKHYYSYQIDSSFFAIFEDSYIQQGSLQAELTLDKTETLIRINFKVNGTVELTCDRSLEQFDFQILLDEGLIFKYGDDYTELTEEIILIPRNLQTLNVAQYIYEFIGLSVPMKKLHPRFITEENHEDAESILIYTSEETEEKGEKEEKSDEGDEDPRWKILKNIRNNYN
ncbi:DUF177 domain-containing protein [Cytophagaceae bacterium ABcell3]|nr:DUF177 domain-containing protein [Cytophagaceae bacterium ABcell3]